MASNIKELVSQMPQNYQQQLKTLFSAKAIDKYKTQVQNVPAQHKRKADTMLRLLYGDFPDWFTIRANN